MGSSAAIRKTYRVLFADVFALVCSWVQRTNVVEFARDTEKNAMSNEKKDKMMQDGVSRRSVLGMGSAALAAAAFVGLSAHAQTREGTHQAERDHSLRRKKSWTSLSQQ